MHHLLRVSFSASLIFIISALPPVYPQNKSIENIVSELELILNKKNEKSLNKILSKEIIAELTNKYKDFIHRFPNAQWAIKPLGKIKDNEIILDIKIKAEQEIDNEKFTLEVKQITEIKVNERKIVSLKLINESSILKSVDSPLKVTIKSPNIVLTGVRYDIDIILEDPLGENFLTGGIMIVDRDKLIRGPTPYIDLLPLGAGGLFKSIQAPFKPGEQTLAALLIHPKGIISITKLVKIVSNEQEINI